MTLTTTDRWYVQKMTGIGTAGAVFTDDELDDLYSEAGDNKDQTVLLVLYALMGNYAKLYDYRLAQSSESQSQVFKHIQQLIAVWEKKAQTDQQVRIVSMRSVPPHDKTEPAT